MDFSHRTFTNERIPLDGNEYTHCKFESCTLVFAGAQPFSMDDNEFSEDTRVEFTAAAGLTIQIMQGLYHGGFHAIIEQTFANIRQKPGPTAPPSPKSN